MNRFNNNYYDYSNLISTDTHENMDTFFIDIPASYDFCRNHTKRECRSGSAVRAFRHMEGISAES